MLRGRSLGRQAWLDHGLQFDAPWQQFLDATDRVIGDALNNVAQIRFRVEAIELGGADQAVDAGGAFAAGIRAAEELVFALMEISP